MAYWVNHIIWNRLMNNDQLHLCYDNPMVYHLLTTICIMYHANIKSMLLNNRQFSWSIPYWKFIAIYYWRKYKVILFIVYYQIYHNKMTFILYLLGFQNRRFWFTWKSQSNVSWEVLNEHNNGDFSTPNCFTNTNL